MNNYQLKLFIDPDVLWYTGRTLLAQFFARFTHLLPTKYTLPTTYDDWGYSNALALVLRDPQAAALPDPLVQAVHEVEALAVPENWPVPEHPEDGAPQHPEAYRLFKAFHRWLEEHPEKTTGLQTTGLQTTGPLTSGPLTTGPLTSGPLTTGPLTSGPLTSGPLTPQTPPTEAAAGSPSPEGSASQPASPSIQADDSSPEHKKPSGASPPDVLSEISAAAQPALKSVERSEIAIPRDTPHSEPPASPAIEPIENPSQPSTFNLQPSTPENETEEQTFLRLARLSPTEYDRARCKEARRLGVRARVLDKEVARRRSQLDDAQANGVILPTLEPWPEPVNDAPALFSQISGLYSRRIVLPAGGPVTVTLWTGHTHVFWVFHITPRLNLLSPEPGCGKSTSLELIGTMVPRPLSADSLTPGVMVRVVDARPPTLLLDELDAYLRANNELRGLLNAGHKRGGCAYRCEGGGNKVRAYKAFAPAALAGIGTLPATLRDRSILIPLVMAKEGEILEPFDPNNTKLEHELGRKLARWAKDNFAAIQACKPALPPGIFNRVADNWRPLFAIAQVVGGDWPQRALDAFASLNQGQTASVDDSAVALLGDIRRVFTLSGAARIFCSRLVEALCAMPDRPYGKSWGRNGHAGRLDEVALGRSLRPFGIRSRTMRIGDGRARGYALEDFTDAFAQWLKGS